MHHPSHISELSQAPAEPTEGGAVTGRGLTAMIKEYARAAAESRANVPASGTWRIASAIWDLGEWLVHIDGESVEAFAPPGVGLTEEADDMSARFWRRATWSEVRRFEAGLLPATNTLVVGDLLDVAAHVPTEHHPWLIEQTRAHAQYLESSARLIALSPSTTDHTLLDELLDMAMREVADCEQLHSSVLAGGGEADRVRAEVVALVRLIHTEVGEAANRDVLDAGMRELELRIFRLVRHHAYVTNSLSWRITGWLRTARSNIFGRWSPRAHAAHHGHA
jgi:hypothetical protein